jgi:preprotein translocase subunit SecF
MEFIKPGINIDFLRYRRVALSLSGLLLVASLLSLWVKGGPKYGIDFAGGIVLQIQFHEQVETSVLRDALQGLELGQVVVQEFGSREDREFLVRLEKRETDLQALQQKVEEALKGRFGAQSLELRRTELVGPKVGEELRKKGLNAVLFAIVGILVYITWRFEFRFALGAILALVHDSLITIGVFSILNKEIDLPIVAAILTIIGYSVNDTIIVFDRIRENMRRIRRQSLERVINDSINETLSRTLLTSMTTLIVVVALFLLGGAVIHDFAFALIIGIAVGTYSSIYIASPLVVFWDAIRARSSRQAKPGRNSVTSR